MIVYHMSLNMKAMSADRSVNSPVASNVYGTVASGQNFDSGKAKRFLECDGMRID